jgi:hypothetical protein
MKKTISIIAACVGAPLLAAGIAIPSASAGPTNDPGPGPTVSNQPDDPGLAAPGLAADVWARQFWSPLPPDEH